MKLVAAIIQPGKLDDVRDRLNEIGVHGLTAAEVKGYGRQKGHTEMYRGSEYKVDFHPKYKIEVAIEDELVAKVMECIAETAGTGKIGDGKIFVTPLENAMRIRTREVGVAAL